MFKDGIYLYQKKNKIYKNYYLYIILQICKYYEFDAIAIAEDELEDLDIQIDALECCKRNGCRSSRSYSKS
jgi:hypothetical protein